MLKAVREAKDLSSWAHPNEEYERALREFIDAVLAEESDFLADFLPFQRRIANIGLHNSLSQLLLKLTSPGVPDTYQGNEVWDFSLVDPDNRRTVDYDSRRELLKSLKDSTGESGPRLAARDIAGNIKNGAAKLFLTWKVLHARQSYRAVFEDGEYAAMQAMGAKAEHVVAFSRTSADTRVITVAPRLWAGLWAGSSIEVPDSSAWEDTTIEIPADTASVYRNLLTGEAVSPGLVALTELLRTFPVALLISES
jgi:(1->4)-alpha-D-glucan 1-alpha-D-glucosylmutase